MHRLLLSVVLTLSSGLVLAVEPTVNCSGCVSLKDFGNFGAAQLFRSTGALSATVGNDRIWVVNPETGKRVFVDLDTPMTSTFLFGIPIPIPDFTQTEVNATWSNGSNADVWILPNEVVVAMGECIDMAESDATPAVTAEELPDLAGFNDSYVWQFIGAAGGVSPGRLAFNQWAFSVLYISGGPTPVVTIIECAWSSAC